MSNCSMCIGKLFGSWQSQLPKCCLSGSGRSQIKNCLVVKHLCFITEVFYAPFRRIKLFELAKRLVLRLKCFLIHTRRVCIGKLFGSWQSQLPKCCLSGSGRSQIKNCLVVKHLCFMTKLFYAPEGRIKLKSFLKENQNHNYNKTHLVKSPQNVFTHRTHQQVLHQGDDCLHLLETQSWQSESRCVCAHCRRVGRRVGRRPISRHVSSSHCA